MSDGTLIIDTALDPDGIKEDLGKLDKNIQKGVTSMAETIGSSVAEGLIDNMLKTLGDGVLEALEESMSPEEAEAFGKKLGDMAAQAYIDGWTQEDFNALGESIIKDVESGAKERALAVGEAVGEDVAEGFQSEVNEDTGEKAGKKVQDGLEDKLDKDDGKKLGKESGKGIGEGIEEGAKPGIASTGELIKGILTADAIKSLAKSAFGAIKDFAKEGIQLASDLAESQNVVDVTFGESAGAINEWAKNAKAGYGMSELAAKKYNGTMGAMFKSMGKTEKEAADMSLTMVGLAGDMASFYNLEHDEAFNKIRSGISGETEPLKQLGINMSVANLEAYALSQGIKKSYDSMTQAEQATLRYNYLLSATADAQGDFVRNGDSYANQMKVWDTNLNELKTTIGAALLPVLTSAVSWLNNLFDGTGKAGLSSEIQTAVDGLNSIRTDVSNIQNEYAKTTIKIQLDYQASQTLLDELVKLQETPNLDLAGTERIKEITQALVDMYPELSKYVGADGIIHKEAEEVRALVGEYTALNDLQAYGKMVKDLQTLSAQRELDLELVRGEREEYYQQLVAANEYADGLKAAKDALGNLYGGAGGIGSQWMTLSTYAIGDQAEALRTLESVAGGFLNLDWSKLDGINTGLLFDESGLLKSTEYFEQNADAAAELLKLVPAVRAQLEGDKTLFGYTGGLVEQAEKDAEAVGAKYEATSGAIDSSTVALEESNVKLEAAQKIYDKKAGSVDTDTVSINANTAAVGENTAVVSESEMAIARQYSSLRSLETEVMRGNISMDAYNARAAELRAEQELLASTLGVTVEEMDALNRTYSVSESELKALSAAGATYEQIVGAAKLGASTTDGIVSKIIGRTEEDVQRLTKAGMSYQAILADMDNGGARIQQVLDATDEEAAKVVAKTIAVEDLVARIAEAGKAGSEAESAMETAKTNMGEDAAAILEQMQGVLTQIGTDIDTLVKSVPTIIEDGEAGATTAGRDLAKATGDGYRQQPYLKDAVTASLSEALATLAATNSMFNNAGRNLISSVAQGVRDNSGVLASAMQAAVQSAIATAQSAPVASYGSRFGYPHRAGLEYVPYDEYPASLHKGEAVLTATEAALWRGGMYVQEPQARGAQFDYDAMARAIWANAPEGGDTFMVMSDEIVGRLTEPTVSTLQGRRTGG